MKNKRLFLSIISIALSGSLCGCSLAVPDAGAEGGGDFLVGVFVTTEHLDLFDIDAYLNDHASQIVNKSEVNPGYDARYEEKLYASIDKSGGEKLSDWEISFGDIEGMNLFFYVQTDENGEKTWNNVAEEGICDAHSDINITDDTAEHNISGTIYILPGKADEDVAYYMNPVYQTADGEIYAGTGSGVSTSGETSEGACFSTTLSGEMAVTEGGRTKTDKNSVTVNVEVMYKPLTVTLYQMDGENQVLKQESYKTGRLPDSLTTEPGTEYILAVTEKESIGGEKLVSREVLSYNEEEERYLQTFYPMDSGIVAKQSTEIDWNK